MILDLRYPKTTSRDGYDQYPMKSIGYLEHTRGAYPWSSYPLAHVTYLSISNIFLALTSMTNCRLIDVVLKESNL